jgi:hypothetical protein
MEFEVIDMNDDVPEVSPAFLPSSSQKPPTEIIDVDDIVEQTPTPAGDDVIEIIDVDDDMSALLVSEHVDVKSEPDMSALLVSEPDSIDNADYIGGAAVTYRSNHNEHVQIGAELKPFIPQIISECSLIKSGQGATCSSPAVIKQIGNIAGATGCTDDKCIIDHAKTATGCKTEKCVLEKYQNDLGPQIVKAEIMNNFKLTGPTDVTWLNNTNIDNTLKQWSVKFTDFYPYNFNMLNYASFSYERGRVVARPDSLATVNPADLFGDGKYKTAGCIINTDIYQGGGKHWMALFVDTRTTPATVEFFNSSANPPAPEYVNWMVKTRTRIEDIVPKVELCNVSVIRHQQSQTECGVYSLFYIWARLNNISYKYFMSTPVPDQVMFEFRQHLFCNSALAGKQFDFKEFCSKVNVKWE